MVTIENSNNAMANANNFNAIETLTVEQFKELYDVPSISLVRSPKTGKLFFTWVTKDGQRHNGKVSTRGKGEDGRILNPVISKMDEVDPQTGENIFMLHEQSTDNVLQTL